MGHNSYNIASAFINSDAYNTLDDTQRAEIFPKIYNFSKALADSELFGYDIASSKTYKKMYEIYQDKEPLELQHSSVLNKIPKATRMKTGLLPSLIYL